MLWLLACQAPVAPTATPAPTPEKPAAPKADVSTMDLVAIGDLHSDPDALERVLRMTGLVDVGGTWIGGATKLVVTGDMIDRGPDSKNVLRRLRELHEAGHALPLLGNHEVMNLHGDLRYVSPEDVAGYGGDAARATSFASGPDGTWLRTLDGVAMIGDTVFAHGGIDATWAKLGVAGLNAEIRKAVMTDPKAAVLGPDGPLWNRSFLLSDPAQACPQLDLALSALGAARMVIGHTRQDSGKIAVRCEGRLVGIDTGLSRAYGGPNDAALRIKAGVASELYPTP